MANEYLVAWGHGRSNVDAVREAGCDWSLREQAPEANEFLGDGSDDSHDGQPDWIVALESTDAMREDLDRDPACAGYVTRSM